MLHELAWEAVERMALWYVFILSLQDARGTWSEIEMGFCPDRYTPAYPRPRRLGVPMLCGIMA